MVDFRVTLLTYLLSVPSHLYLRHARMRGSVECVSHALLTMAVSAAGDAHFDLKSPNDDLANYLAIALSSDLTHIRR